MSSLDIPEPIRFLHFATLVRDIAIKSKPKSIAQRKAAGKDQAKAWFPALDVFKDFARKSQLQTLRPGTTSIIFRFLFPEEDQKRKFGYKGESLIRDVVYALGISEDRVELENGDAQCPGDHVYALLDSTYCHDDDYDGNLDIFQVEEILNQLAATSPWSQSLRTKDPDHRPSVKKSGVRKDILKSLYRKMSPCEAAVLTQIILKDLRPILYPHLENNSTVALKNYNTKAVRTLTKDNAMWAWDWSNRMSKAYRARWDIDAAAKAFEDKEELGPQPGCQIAVPKSHKGRSCKHALSFFSKSSQVWAETKYDGERAQIHVRIVPGGKPYITIFSKSKRESTGDRNAVHAVILNCLGLDGQTGVQPRIKKSVILDAEMVACEETKILEFWRIRRLIGETAIGVRKRTYNDHYIDDGGSESSLISDAEGQHLALVFFDVMYLDDNSLIQEPYDRRRQILETLIVTEPGWSMLADRWLIDLNDYSFDSLYDEDDDEREDIGEESAARHALYTIFAKRLAFGEEGLVLKAAKSAYNDLKNPWVKLKKDYIPGLGDTVDLVLLAAVHDPERAQELRVPTSTLTTFYIGAQTNKQEMTNNSEALPNFFIYFTASYGLSRAELEQLNFLIRTDDPIKCGNKGLLPRSGLEYTYDMYDKLPRPELMLREPILAELFGDRFTVSQGSKEYELRWPRITKYYRRHQRGWADSMSLQELRVQAREAMGRLSAKEAAQAEIERTFLQRGTAKEDTMSVHNLSVRMHEKVEMWREMVAEADKPKKGRGHGGTKLRLIQNGDRSKGPSTGENLATISKKRRLSISDDLGIPATIKRKPDDNGDEIPTDLAGWCISASRRTISLPSSASGHVPHTTLNRRRELEDENTEQLRSLVTGANTSHPQPAIPPTTSHISVRHNRLLDNDDYPGFRPIQSVINIAHSAVGPTISDSSHTTLKRSRMRENGDNTSALSEAGNYSAGPSRSAAVPRTSQIPVVIHEDDAVSSSVISGPSLQTATNKVQSAFHDVFTPRMTQSSTDENTQPGAGGLSSLELSRPKHIHYPSPPTSPMKSHDHSASIIQAHVDPFFRDAAFWQPPLKANIPGRKSVKFIIKSGTQLNGLEAFLIACRWIPDAFPTKPPPPRGIVFLDFMDEYGSGWERNLLDAVKELNSERMHIDGPRRTIWVFSRRTEFKDGTNPRNLALHVLT